VVPGYYVPYGEKREFEDLEFTDQEDNLLKSEAKKS
jgi:hypothetical protein